MSAFAIAAIVVRLPRFLSPVFARHSCDACLERIGITRLSFALAAGWIISTPRSRSDAGLKACVYCATCASAGWDRTDALVGGIVVAAIFTKCMAPSGERTRSFIVATTAAAGSTLVHENVEIRSDGLLLRGWRFPALGEARGSILYLHGTGDDRRGSEGSRARFGPLGFDVTALTRALRDAAMVRCARTASVEKRDLARILDTLPSESAALSVVLIGSSLGGAICARSCGGRSTHFDRGGDRDLLGFAYGGNRTRAVLRERAPSIKPEARRERGRLRDRRRLAGRGCESIRCPVTARARCCR